MWKYIFKNTFWSLVVFFLMLIFIYVIYVTINGNPFESQRALFLSNEAGYKTLLKTNQVDLPPFERAGKWFIGIFNGDFGRIYNSSVTQEKNVVDASLKPYLDSVRVQLPAYLFTLLFGFGFGIISGYLHASKSRTAKYLDNLIQFSTLIFSIIPAMTLAVFLVLASKYIGLPTIYDAKVGGDFLVLSLILPILVITITGISYYTRRLRIEIGSVLLSDFILAARSKGYSEFFIFRRYVFRNSFYPFVSELATAYLVIFNSSLVTEIIFNVPGTATLLLSAFQGSEINLLMFNVFFFGLVYNGISIISEAANLAINPLVRASLGNDSNFFKIAKAFIRRLKNVQINQNESTLDQNIVGLEEENIAEGIMDAKMKGQND